MNIQCANEAYLRATPKVFIWIATLETSNDKDNFTIDYCESLIQLRMVLCKELLLVVAVVVGIGYCQDCSPPTASDMETVIAAIIQSGDASTDPVITIADFKVVCRAFSQQEDLLRGVSVVVEYTCTDHANCPTGTVTEQIESGCSSGSWTNRVAGTTDPTRLRTTSPTATLSTTARDDCSFCFSEFLADDAGAGFPTDPVTHCVGEWITGSVQPILS